MTAQILREFFRQISEHKTPVKHLEVEHLVLLEWNRKNYLKTQFEQEYKFAMLPHEAISLHRMLFATGLSDPLAAITRDGLCEQINRQIPINQSRLQMQRP